ncbi:MAG: UDP-N-acetylmuramate--L-alanine ligase [Oscillospiraceae bacterium]
MTDKNILNGKKHIHFIGIGGSGMYPLAQILHSQGYFLSGSDNNETETLDLVRKMGISVSLGQNAANILGADLIVHTAAIMADNPELIAAKQSGVPVLERSELLGIITSWYDNALCVSGTHGKTTTTSMLTQILVEQGIDISAFIGGKLPVIGGSGKSGTSDILTCEACEFVDTFLKLYPDIAIILNIDADHLDYFKTVDNIIKSFHKFCENATKAVIVNGDDENSMKAIEGISSSDKKIITFGFSSKNDYYPENITKINGMQTNFSLMKNGEKLCDLEIHVPGIHNVINAVAACVGAIYVGADVKKIADGLKNFYGAERRFEKIGTVGGVTIVDDYAHHPAEISVTLNAAKEMKFRRVWAVFQPFTFSRTAMLLNDFATALSVADKVVLTEIMGSREKNTYHIYAKDLGEKIENAVWFDNFSGGETAAEYHDRNFNEICEYLADNVKDGDLVITLGCGDVYKVAKKLYKMLSGGEKNA